MSHGSDGEATHVHLIEDGRGGVTLCVHGEIDVVTAPQLAACARRALDLAPQLVVDLSETTFMDSTGISVIIEAFLDLDRDPSRVVLLNPSAAVLRVLQVTGLDDLVTIEGRDGGAETDDQALTADDPPAQ